MIVVLLYIQNIALKNFRCFEQAEFELSPQLNLIVGANGSGKSSFVEALYYACYLKSFRTNSVNELIQFNAPGFFVKLDLVNDGVTHAVQAGFTDDRRLVKIDGQAIQSYKQLIAQYKIITMHEDDLAIIKGAPETRRLFIDQALLLHGDEGMQQLRKYKQILRNRNALLKQETIDKTLYQHWTDQLWKYGIIVQESRKKLLKELELQIQQLLQQWHIDPIEIAYKDKMDTMRFDASDQFLAYHSDLWVKEYALHRSLFGPQVDDISIQFKQQSSRHFASRGQQKLVMIFLKIAEIKTLLHQGHKVILLLDDFMTDFDEQRGKQLIELLCQLPVQLIFTSPIKQSVIGDFLIEQGARYLSL